MQGKYFLVFVLTMLSITTRIFSQDTKAAKEAIIQKKVLDKQYDLVVQTAIPSSGEATRQLTPGYYDLRVADDSIISFLPYFGRAYSAPFDPSEMGIKFTSVKCEYRRLNRNDGGWDIMIRPKDVADVQQLFLTIFPGGTASVQVMPTNRQPISFTGYIAY